MTISKIGSNTVEPSIGREGWDVDCRVVGLDPSFKETPNQTTDFFLLDRHASFRYVYNAGDVDGRLLR